MTTLTNIVIEDVCVKMNSFEQQLYFYNEMSFCKQFNFLMYEQLPYDHLKIVDQDQPDDKKSVRVIEYKVNFIVVLVIVSDLSLFPNELFKRRHKFQ